MIVDGRTLAREIRARVRAKAARLSRKPVLGALVSPDAGSVTRSYLSMKARSAREAGFIFTELTQPDFSSVDVGLVQFPTPLPSEEIDRVLPREKDADVLTASAREAFFHDERGALLPPVVAAIAEIFERYQVVPDGKQAVVIGRGFLVGEPSALWLERRGAHVRVLTEKDSASFDAVLPTADIIVSGAGKAHIVQPQHLKEGVVLIDAGTSESTGSLAGDMDPACAEKAALCTPVPGGVGPIAVACLFQNAIALAEKTTNT